MHPIPRALAAAAAAAITVGLVTARPAAAESSAGGTVEEISFGVVPLEAPTTMFRKFKPLVRFLEQETGVTVKLAVARDYDGAIEAIGEGTTQIAYLTPTTMPKAQRLYPDAEITPFVRFLSEGAGTYRSCLVVPADGGIDDPAEAAGRRIGFGSESSTSSHLMPRSMLMAAGVDPDADAASVEYLGSHTNVIKAIELGKIDLGGVKQDVAEKAAAAGTVRIVATSNDIPQFPVVFNDHMPEELRARFEAAFEKLNDGSEASTKVLEAISSKYDGTERAKDADYDGVRQMIATLYGEAFYAGVD